jgi:hypothetical protein
MLSKSEQIDILKKLYEVSEYCCGDNPHCYLLNEELEIDDCPYGLICDAIQHVSPCLPEDYQEFAKYIDEEANNDL